MAAQEPAPDSPSPPPQPPRSLRTHWLVWVVAALLLAAIVAGAWLWSRKPAEPAGAAGRLGEAGRPFPVIAAPVTKGPIDVYISALGTVTPRNTVTVRSRVDGQLVRVTFREGQLLKAGELLAEIDPRPFEVQLAQAQGQLARDQALLRNAELDLERYRTLLTQDSISKQQVDTQESLVHQYQGAVKADQGQVDNAKLQLGYARITAPITGVVGLRQVDPGNMIHASDANGICVITQLQPITVLFPIPEDNLPPVLRRLKAGATLAVEVFDRAQKAKLATGKLLTVDNQIDTATGTVKLRAEFANDDGALFPNQFVNVRMTVDTIPDATLVPNAAIQRGAPGTFVYVVNEDHSVSVKPIRLGPVQGEITAAESGVAPGAQVVVDGADKLREGAKVELITPEARAAPGPGAPERGARGEKGKGAEKRGGQPGGPQGSR